MKTVKRLLFALVPVFVIYILPVFFIPQKTSTLLVMVAKYAAPCFWIGHVLFGYSKVVYQRFDLVNIEEIGLKNKSAMNLGEIEEEEIIKGNNQIDKESSSTQNTF